MARPMKVRGKPFKKYDYGECAACGGELHGMWVVVVGRPWGRRTYLMHRRHNPKEVVEHG